MTDRLKAESIFHQLYIAENIKFASMILTAVSLICTILFTILGNYSAMIISAVMTICGYILKLTAFIINIVGLSRGISSSRYLKWALIIIILNLTLRLFRPVIFIFLIALMVDVFTAIADIMVSILILAAIRDTDLSFGFDAPAKEAENISRYFIVTAIISTLSELLYSVTVPVPGLAIGLAIIYFIFLNISYIFYIRPFKSIINALRSSTVN